MGAEVSKLSHAWILRYKTCLYALVEDFMVAGGMWRKMIASRLQGKREKGGRRTPSKSGEWQESCGGRQMWVFVDLLGFNSYLARRREIIQETKSLF